MNGFVKPEIVETNLRDLSEIRVNPDIGLILDVAFLNSELIIAAIMIAKEEFRLVLYNIKQQSIVKEVETGYVMSVCVDYRRNRILAGTVGEDYVSVYDNSLQLQSLFQVEDMPIEMVLSQAGDKLAITGVFFKVWDISDEPVCISEDYLNRKDCAGNLGEASSTDITPDGRYAVSGFVESGHLSAVMDTESGKVIGCFGKFGNGFHVVSDVSISPDGKYVAVAGKEPEIVAIYRVSDGALVYKYTGKWCETIAFSPKWNILAVGNHNSVTLWHFDP